MVPNGVIAIGEISATLEMSGSDSCGGEDIDRPE
jgi:hypothetical protein